MAETRELSCEDLWACLELGKLITSELEERELLGRILQSVSRLLPAQNWSLLLADEATGELRFALSTDLSPEVVRDVRLQPGEGVAGQAFVKQEVVVVGAAEECPHFTDKVDRLADFTTRSLVCVPVVYAGQSLGVIEIVNPVGLDERTPALLGVVADYTAIAVENTRRHARIRELSVKDDLTGLYNTRFLYRDLDQRVSAARESRQPLSLIFMDIDNFKRVVDTYGHPCGSQTIREVAATIRAVLQPPAYGVSYGGDEFVAVLPDTDKRAAVATAQEIRARIAGTTYLEQRGHRVRVSASFGVATLPDDAPDRDGLLALADQALFHVKATGKDAVEGA